MEGWVKLHRKILNNPIFLKLELLQLCLYCILRANHEPNRIIWNKKELIIERGQFITGRDVLAHDLKQNPRTTYDRLKVLENLEIINIKTNNKFTLITVVNYELYQMNYEESNSETNNKPTTNQQQTNTNKNEKNKENEKNLEDPSLPSHSCKNLEKEILNEYQKYLNDHNIERQQRVLEYLDKGLDCDVIIECIREAVTGNMPCKYVFGILDNCVKQKVFTLEQYIERKKEHIKQINEQIAKSKNKRDPNYANYDQREYKEEELEKFYISGTNRINLKSKKLKEVEDEN